MTTRIEILPYDDRWPAEFRALATVLRDALGDLALRIDHIGSTAVPGLPAKDVIDIQVTVADLDAAAISAALAPAGYTPHPTIATDHVPPGADPDPAHWAKLYYYAPVDQRRTHLHVRRAGRANARYPILFRDYLRATPAAAEAYAQIKRALARLHPDDVEAYYDVKDPVCDLIIDAAERWVVTTGWRMGPPDA